MSLNGNLNRIKGALVYSPEETELRALSSHRISFCFPYSLENKEISPKTVILTGTVRSIIFAAGKKIEDTKKSYKLKDLHFDGVSYNVPNDLKKVHEKGEQAMANSSKVTTHILGTRNVSPCFLKVVEYEIALDEIQEFPEEIQITTKLSLLRSLVDKINGMGFRSLVAEQEADNTPCLLTIPREWMIQNLTSLTKLSRKGNPVPIIEIPVAFPSFGTRIFHLGKEFKGEICDFYITSDMKINIRCKQLPHCREITECCYSKLFAESTKDLRSPYITRLLSENERLSFNKVNPISKCYYHVDKARVFIFELLSRWKKVEIPKDYILRMLCMVPSKDDPHTLKSFFMTPQKALDKYCSGENIRLTSVVDCEYTDENENVYKSCISNAVNGDVYLSVKMSKKPVFFSTKNCMGLSMISDPPFEPYETNKTVCIDVLKPPRMLGYPKLNDIPHEDEKRKYMVMWTPVSEQFYSFYLWVVTKTTHPMFRKKSFNELCEMFWDPDQPELVEIYEFMSRGASPEMLDTEKYPWVNWFVQEILMCDLKDLLP